MNGFALPDWLQRMFGVAGGESGTGVDFSYRTAWQLPVVVTLLLVALGVAFFVGLYLLERPAVRRVRWIVLLAALRIGAFLLLLFMLSQFLLLPRRTGLPHLAILVDDSQSMSIRDRYGESGGYAQLFEQLKQLELDGPTRLNLAKTLLLKDDGRLLDQLAGRYKLKLYFVSTAARGQSGELDELKTRLRDLEPQGESTRLGAAIATVLADLRGSPPAAILLLSDGINTEGPSLSDAALSAWNEHQVPLFAVAVGSEEPVKNLELSELTVDEAVFVGDIINFELQLTGTGLEGREVAVRLREQDRPQVLAETTVTVGPDGQPQSVRLSYRPRREDWEARLAPGEKAVIYQFVVETDVLPEEEDPDDNRLPPQAVRVSDERISVLLAQAYPSWEYRYLKTLLEREPSIDLTTVLQEADPDYPEIDRTAIRVFPVRREDLFKYDVLILGDLNPSFLSQSVMQNVADFVAERGGGVVFIGGPRYMPTEYRDTPLADLLPFDPAAVTLPGEGPITRGFTVRPTPQGLASPQMQLGDSLRETDALWSNLPPLYWLMDLNTLKPAARVLAAHPARQTVEGRQAPVIVEQFVGAGTVIFHATDESHRWRFRRGDAQFGRYWVQTLRYLSRSKLLGEQPAELTSYHRTYRRGDAVPLQVRFRDERQAPVGNEDVVVVIEREGDKPRRLTLTRSAQRRGIFTGTFPSAPVGRYHAWIVSPALPAPAPSVDFEVEPPPGEMARLQMDLAELQQAAEGPYLAARNQAGTHIPRTGYGRLYMIDQTGSLLSDLPRGREVVLEPLEPFELWNWFPVPLLLLTLLIAEWLLRKSRGLL